MNENFLYLLKNYTKDEHRKPYWKAACELVLCFAAERSILYYFTHLLYKNDCPNFLNYISTKKFKRIQSKLFNSKENSNAILHDKALFQRFLTENNFPGPKGIGTIKNQIFTKSQNNETTEISNVNGLFELFAGLTAKSKLPLFIKPINGIGGMQTFKLHRNNLDNEIIHTIYNDTFSTNVSIQESLRQHELLSSLYSQSVNTLRVNTFKGSD